MIKLGARSSQLDHGVTGDAAAAASRGVNSWKEMVCEARGNIALFLSRVSGPYWLGLGEAMLDQVQNIQNVGVTGHIGFDHNGASTRGIFSVYTVRDGHWVWMMQE